MRRLARAYRLALRHGDGVASISAPRLSARRRLVRAGLDQETIDAGPGWYQRSWLTLLGAVVVAALAEVRAVLDAVTITVNRVLTLVSAVSDSRPGAGPVGEVGTHASSELRVGVMSLNAVTPRAALRLGDRNTTVVALDRAAPPRSTRTSVSTPENSLPLQNTTRPLTPARFCHAKPNFGLYRTASHLLCPSLPAQPLPDHH
jgi:hypothetical protein